MRQWKNEILISATNDVGDGRIWLLNGGATYVSCKCQFIVGSMVVSRETVATFVKLCTN